MGRRSKAMTLLFHVFVAVLTCVSSAAPAAARARRSAAPAVVAAAQSSATVARATRATRPSPIAKAVDVAPALPPSATTLRIASASWARASTPSAHAASEPRLAIDRPRARAPPR